MKRVFLLPLLFVPLLASAATGTPSTSTIPSNSYLADSHITIQNALPSDLIAIGGTVNVLAPVQGDILVAGGTVTVLQGSGGDVRVAGAKVSVHGPVTGDVAAAGGTVKIVGNTQRIYAAGGSVDVEASSTGSVTIYGVNVFLSGNYQGNVSVVASNRLTIGEGTHIRGQLKYSSPQELTVPPAAVIEGGMRYTGAYAYVPSTQQVHQYAILGSILFFGVRVLAGIIVAGLLAGLFPLLVERVGRIALARGPRNALVLFVIGLLMALCIPLASIFLLITFVGAELSLLLFVAYILLGLVGYAFVGILIGTLLRTHVLYKLRGDHDVSWQDAALGTVVLHLIALLPYIGTPLVLILTLCTVGALCRHLYDLAFTSASR